MASRSGVREDARTKAQRRQLARQQEAMDAVFEFSIPLHVRAERPITFGFQTVTMDDILPEALS